MARPTRGKLVYVYVSTFVTLVKAAFHCVCVCVCAYVRVREIVHVQVRQCEGVWKCVRVHERE